MNRTSFYFTLGQQHIHSLNDEDDIFNTIIWNKDGVVEVKAEHEIDARQFITSLIGDKWASCYDDSNMKFEYFPCGVIKTYII